jgi:hypothetical protein
MEIGKQNEIKNLPYNFPLFLQVKTGLVPISYRGALLSPLLHVSLIPTSYN